MKLAGRDSPLAGANEIEARDGGLYRVGENGAGESYVAILHRAGEAFVEVEESSSTGRRVRDLPITLDKLL